MTIKQSKKLYSFKFDIHFTIEKKNPTGTIACRALNAIMIASYFTFTKFAQLIKLIS